MNTTVTHNPRNDAFAEVVAAATAKTNDELRDSGVDPATLMQGDATAAAAGDTKVDQAGETTTQNADDKTGDTAAAGTDAATQDDPTTQTAADAPRKIKIKVNGKEQEVDEAQVIEAGRRALQKESSADERLQEATRLLRETKETIGATRTQSGPSTTQQQGNNGTATETAEDDLDAKALAHAIQYGSEDEAAEALKKLRGTKSGPTAEEVAAIVDERSQFQAGVTWYRSDCKDIADDPNLHRLFLSKEREKRAAGDQRPYLELYGDIAKEIRDWRGTFAPAGKDPLAEKRDRKAQAGAQPQAASARQPAAKTDPKPPTPSEVVDRMRQARHQTV